MLDQLSIGVAQFDADRTLAFANQPFQRIFALPASLQLDPPIFDRFLDMARDEGRLPEVRDFPAWRRELGGWFSAGEPRRKTWTLSDGTHLRIVAQPMPDGGLVLIAEDRTEQLALSATRDTLLRTRTATFDSLFESLAVFAPDGRMQLWNRRFPQIWGLPDEFLDEHPRIEARARTHRPRPRAPGPARGDRRSRARGHARPQAARRAGDDGRRPHARVRRRPAARRQRPADRARRDRFSKKAEDALRERSAGARGSRRGQDPLPRQHELRVPHAR